MSSIEKYELLKCEETVTARINYIQSLRDKNEIEIHLKKAVHHSYDDLQMLVFLSKSTKNKNNLIDIFKNASFPVRQRADAAKAWIQFQDNETQIYKFVVETISDLNVPRM